MSVSLKRFVDVNIKAHTAGTFTGTRDTVMIYTADGESSEVIDDITAQNYLVKCEGLTNVLAYLAVYFKNGGIKARVMTATAISSITSVMLSNLDNELICIAYASADPDATYSAFLALAKSREADSSVYGINEKILLARTTDVDKTESVKNLAVKYSDVAGAEMTMAAYLSKVNVYEFDSVYDYMYTEELIKAAEPTDEDYAAIIVNNMNVDVSLAGSVRNCGGNMKDGSDLVNSYVLIILHQTLTNKVIQLLSQKIKNSVGLSKIYAVVSQDLASYLSCGYLSTDKVWTDQDLIISYNNESYTIIEKGTAMTDGYVVKILPFNALTDDDKAAHKAPPIYVVLATQYGIRAITINGEVI